MALTIILVFCVPIAFIILVFAAIGMAGAKTYRTAKRAYADVKPYINDLSSQAARAQEKGNSFANRGASIGKTFEEIAGRWAFVTQTVTKSTNSPVNKAIDIVGRFIK